MKTSKFLRLNWYDVLKGFLVAFMAFALNYLQTTFVPQMEVSPEIKTLIFAGLAYITKNFFTKPIEE